MVADDREWCTIVDALRKAPNPYQSPAFAELWSAALADAPRLLAGFVRQGKLDTHRVTDLVGDWLLGEGHLQALLASDQNAPRKLFATSLIRAALSWIRRPSAKVQIAEPSREPAVAAPDHVFTVHARRRLGALPPRDRDILLAVHAGEDREALAAHYGISRAGIDQIVSRSRRIFGAE
jgi:DNA-directed RNA polymerase specialized sigma24 family protein